MYLTSRHTGVALAAIAANDPPLGPKFSDELIAQSSLLEIYGTTIHDAGEYCDFILKDEKGQVVATKRIPGY